MLRHSQTNAAAFELHEKNFWKSEPSMPQHWVPNAAAFEHFEEIGLQSETSMPQHSVTNAAAFEVKFRKIKRPTSVSSSLLPYFSLTIETLSNKTLNTSKSLNTQLFQPPNSSSKTLNPTSKSLNFCYPSTKSWFQRIFLLESYFFCGFSSNKVSVPIFES